MTGGAGYVGSVSVEGLLAAGHEVVVLDDLSTGHRGAAGSARLVEGSYADGPAVRALLDGEGIEAILHCAARSLVSESIVDPARYYRDNVAGGVDLLEAARMAGVRRIVFSSTAAVYGIPRVDPDRRGRAARPDQPVRRDEALVRGRAALVRQRLRPAQRGPALFQRRRGDRPERRGAPARDPSHPQRARRPPRRAGRWRSSGRTTRPRTGRTSATSSMSRTWPTRTWPLSRPPRRPTHARATRTNPATGREVAPPRSISAAPPASASAKSLPPPSGWSAGRSRRCRGHADPAIRPSSSPRTDAPGTSSAGHPDEARLTR